MRSARTAQPTGPYLPGCRSGMAATARTPDQPATWNRRRWQCIYRWLMRVGSQAAQLTHAPLGDALDGAARQCHRAFSVMIVPKSAIDRARHIAAKWKIRKSRQGRGARATKQITWELCEQRTA